jgi:hypothetical protein
VALTEFARAKWFNDESAARRYQISEEIVKLFTFLIRKNLILGRRLRTEEGAEFFGIVRSYPPSAKLTDEQIADVFEVWLKPFVTVYLAASLLFDDRIILSGFPYKL